MSKPQYHIRCVPGDVGRYVFLPGDPGRAELIAQYFEAPRLVAQNREYTTYTGTLGGVKVSVTSTGIGAPSTAIAVEELAKVGADTFVRVGTAGARQRYIEIGELIIATAAVRDEGTTPQYIPIEYPAVASTEVLTALMEGAKKTGVPFRVGILHSKDSFYSQSETDRIPSAKDILERREAFIAGNVLASEMEASAIFVIASILNLRAGAIVKVLNNRLVESFDTEKAMEMGLEDLVETAIEGLRILMARDRSGES